MSQKNNFKEIEFVLDRFEGAKAVLKYEDQELVVAKKFLDRDVKEGDVLISELMTEKRLTKRRENVARAILEEILKGE